MGPIGRRGSEHSPSMDLHVIGPLASPAERAAVDAVLGPPESGWVGGPRDSGDRRPRGARRPRTRARRSQLLPALHAVQSRIGWISQPALNYICKRLAVAAGRGLRRRDVLRAVRDEPRPPVVAHVCDDIACRLAGAEASAGTSTRALGPAGRAGSRRPSRLAALAVPGAVRPGAGGDGHDRRRDAGDVRARARRCRRRRRRARGGPWRRGRVHAPRPSRRQTGVRLASSAGSASSTRPRSTTTAPTAATRP